MSGNVPSEWLKFAERDLRIAGLLGHNEEYEAGIYHLQQAAEKGLKAVLVFEGIRPPRTHNIARLIALLTSSGITVPEEIQKAQLLSQYAFSTRYPDDYVPVGKEEYEEAYEIAKRVLEWAKEIVRP